MLLTLALIVTAWAAWLTLQAVRPLFDTTPTSADWRRSADEGLTLLARRERLVAELKDLEFEAALGKLDEAQLTELRARYEGEALEVMAALDERLAHARAHLAEEIS